MGNNSSTEDEEYETMYQNQREGARKKYMTEYEGLLHNDKLKTGACLPVDEIDEWFQIDVKKGKQRFTDLFRLVFFQLNIQTMKVIWLGLNYTWYAICVSHSYWYS